MNCLFAAKRRKVLVDACSVAPSPSPLMRQAAHLAGGIFAHVPPDRLDRLLATALASFAADAACRERLALPRLAEADFRVACLCCAPPKLLARGYCCTTCLSVYCRPDFVCPCSAGLKAAAAGAAGT